MTVLKFKDEKMTLFEFVSKNHGGNLEAKNLFDENQVQLNQVKHDESSAKSQKLNDGDIVRVGRSWFKQYWAH